MLLLNMRLCEMNITVISHQTQSKGDGQGFMHLLTYLILEKNMVSRLEEWQIL